MNYSLNIGTWNSVFAVPTELVDKHLKLASAEQLKVILFLLRNNSQSFSLEEIAKGISASADVTEDAIEYWIQADLLMNHDNILLPKSSTKKSMATSPVYVTSTDDSNKPLETEKPQKPSKRRIIRPDGLHVAKRINESSEVRMLMTETENILGKTLSPSFSSIILSMIDDYGLPPEVILMLIGYAKSVGKTSSSYIESLARDWSSNEITTIKAAEEKLTELEDANRAWRKVEGVLGIFHRSPTKKESEFSYRWIMVWKTSDELISEAYERCINQTGKLSMAYMNKIIEKWHKHEITSLEQVIQSEDKNRNNKTQNSKSYDINEFENISFLPPVED